MGVLLPGTKRLSMKTTEAPGSSLEWRPERKVERRWRGTWDHQKPEKAAENLRSKAGRA